MSLNVHNRFSFKNDTTVSIVYTTGTIHRARIEVINNCSENDSITVGSLTPVYIGRQAKKCTLVINSMDISRLHCIVEYDDNRRVFIVTDVSTNGTFFEGSRLPKNIAVVFESGTVLSLTNDKHRIKLI